MYELLQRPLDLPTFSECPRATRPAHYQIELKKRGDALAQVLLRSMAIPDDRFSDALTLAQELQATYDLVVGQPYPRKMLSEIESPADGLNNQAFSMIELDRKEEAEKLLSDALKIDSNHPEAVYNHGLLLWRSGRITDIELLRQLRMAQDPGPGEWRYRYLIGLIHLGRGDLEGVCEGARTGIWNS